MNINNSFISKFKYPTWIWILFFITVFFFTKELYGVSDFRIFYMASKDFLLDVDVYKTLYVNGLKYYYSPMFAMTLGAFTFLDVQVLGWIWTLLNILMIYKIWKMSMEYFDLTVFTKNDLRNFSLLAFFLGVGLIYFNLHNHQMTIFLVWGILFSLKMNREGSWIVGAAVLAFIINIKIIPIIIIPYLIYRAEWKFLIGTIFFFVVYLLMPALVVGYDHNLELHSSWWELLNPQNKEHLIDNSEKGLSSLSTFFPVYLMDSASWDENYSFARNVANISSQSVITITQVSRGIMLLLVFYFLRSLPFRKEKNRLKQFWEIGYIMAAGVLIFPHQQAYGFFLFWPVLIYISYYLIVAKSRLKSKNWVILFSAILLISVMINAEFLIGDLRHLWSYIKLLTWGSLMILPFYFNLTPKKIQRLISKIS